MLERRIYRKRTDRVFAGVCSGLGDYTKTDPLIWRVIFCALIFLGGAGFILYLIAWVAIPLEPSEIQVESFSRKRPSRLFRSSKECMLSGVCGGLAIYFNWDPAWVRVLALLAMIVSVGVAVLIYVVLCFALPLSKDL